MIITIICITILAYAISGKDINGLLDKLKNVDWKKKSSNMLGKIGTYKELGYYTNSSKLFNIPLGIITGLESVFLPRSAILFSESRDKGFGFLTKSFEIICFFTFAITFGIAGCKEKFIPLFFGEGYERCITLTYYFVPVVIVQAISSFFRTNLIAHGGTSGLL